VLSIYHLIKHTTLALIHVLMPNSNAKKLFGTICSVDVLPRLGRLKMVQVVNNENENIESLTTTRAMRRRYLTHFEIDGLFWRDNRSAVRMLGGRR